MKNFKTYQKSLQFYKICKSARLPYYLKNQLLRASSSISLNLAEGNAKPTKKDQKRFFQISMASLRECQAVFDLNEIKDSRFIDLSDELAAMLFCLIKSKL
jgi:four helix bundle protein